MRIGLVEFILILFIASVTVGPQVALFVDGWLRRANRASALAARRKAEAQAQMAIEREALLHRFRAASNVFAALAAVALVYALVFRPIDTPPKTYAAPERAERAEHVRGVDPADALNLSAYEIGTAIRMQDGWLYAAAKLPKAGVLMRMQPDGSGMNEVLDVAGGEITDLAFAPDGTLWMTTIEADGGKLCIAWTDADGNTLGRAVYHLDHVLERGLEGKENALFAAEDVPADWPFRCLLAMEPMPPRAARLQGGLLSHLHFQYASGPEHLFDTDTHALRSPLWYATMCDGDGTLLEQCNIVRALHRLPVWEELPEL